MIELLRSLGVWLIAGVFLAGCSSVKRAHERDPNALLAEICSIGRQFSVVNGSLWLKAESPEASGQFPADVRMDGPGMMKMEVTNLLGGTEAIIEVLGDRFELKTVLNGRPQVQKGAGSWAGIPLEWATALVLGRFPCPGSELIGTAKLSTPAENVLSVEVPRRLGKDEQIFIYHLRVWGGQLWPFRVEWTKKGSFGNEVNFEFEDPEDGSHIPRRWSARSKKGAVKVRWKSRQAS